ncbi:hypothetical protein H8D73_01465 [bacterium]|nr:hypothetical protein [bacterium]
MHMRRVLILLVVLALGSLLIAGAANSAIRTDGPSGDSQVDSSIAFMEEGDGELGGDDDRWGDATPGDPEDIPDPEVPGEGGDIGDDPAGQTSKQFIAEGGLWGVRMRMVLNWMFWIL